MKKWRTPPMSNWESPFIWVCFSDDCGYFQRSEAWMQEKFNVRASYRHRLDPLTGETGPLPVWSRDALKDQIVEEEEDDSVSDAGLGDKESSQ
ncbi:MAG TPA: hypothetical protein PLV85_01515 [Polyangiaceae bacterium]|nr:hypothetical protein [Polyangiaceae bacterium]